MNIPCSKAVDARPVILCNSRAADLVGDFHIFMVATYSVSKGLSLSGYVVVGGAGTVDNSANTSLTDLARHGSTCKTTQDWNESAVAVLDGK